MRIAVIDGQGGGIGVEITSRIRRDIGEDVEIVALGTNAVATANMMKAGANKGASGENAIKVNCSKADVICGSSAITAADSMMGEMTAASAAAIEASDALKLLLPLTVRGVELIGLKKEPLPHLIDALIKRIKILLEGGKKKDV